MDPADIEEFWELVGALWTCEGPDSGPLQKLKVTNNLKHENKNYNHDKIHECSGAKLENMFNNNHRSRHQNLICFCSCFQNVFT